MKKLNNELELIEMLSQSYGNFDSYLERSYVTKIASLIIKSNVEEVRLWLTLNEIVSQFKISNLPIISKELQFLLTNNPLNKWEVILLLDYNINIEHKELVRLSKKLKQIWNF
jgi:hypothetical protein